MKGTALCQFESYPRERYQVVMYAGTTAPATKGCNSVSQGMVRGPLLFIMYTADIQCIVNGHQLMCLCYADNTQVYINMKVYKFR